MLSDEQMTDLKIAYQTACEELEEIEKNIEKYGILDNGISDATETFEQGYKNALDFIMNLLEIKI